MKKTILSVATLIVALAFANTSKAQINVSININSQPDWGPRGYDYVEYYYMPDIEAYYYVPSRQFIYLTNGRWIFSTTLPYRYRTYNIYSGYKVVINQPRPYLHFGAHKLKYAKYKGYNSRQVIILNIVIANRAPYGLRTNINIY